MSENVAKITLPLGARSRKRQAAPKKSIDLAEQLALRGASESLVRAVGGDEAVEKLKNAGAQARRESAEI
jgi:hypothetical protein